MRRSELRGVAAIAAVATLIGGAGCRFPALPGQRDSQSLAQPKMMRIETPADKRGHEPDEAPVATAQLAGADGQALSSAEAMVAARKLVRTGEIALVVDDYDAAAAEVERIAAAGGGYVAATRLQRGAHDRRFGTLTVRVRAERYAEAVAALRALGKVERETSEVRDITREYADLATRLAVKREARERLRQILRSRTGKLAEVLEVERELARVTEEIDRAEGERRYWDQLVALSTIAVELSEPAALVRPGVLQPLRDAIGDALSVLVTSIAYLVYLTVFVLPWLALATVLWWLLRRVRRRRA